MSKQHNFYEMSRRVSDAVTVTAGPPTACWVRAPGAPLPVPRETTAAIPLWMCGRDRQGTNRSLWELQLGITVSRDRQLGNTERSGGAPHPFEMPNQSVNFRIHHPFFVCSVDVTVSPLSVDSINLVSASVHRSKMCKNCHFYFHVLNFCWIFELRFANFNCPGMKHLYFPPALA